MCVGVAAEASHWAGPAGWARHS